MRELTFTNAIGPFFPFTLSVLLGWYFSLNIP